ncbi:MAG: hypothetical protein ACW974_12990 [Candidatus Thorarchaeota archaeon]
MRRAPLCLSILTLVLLLLPAGARALDREYQIQPDAIWTHRLSCRASEILEIAFSATATHIDSRNDNSQIGFTLVIRQYYYEPHDGTEVFALEDVRHLTWRFETNHTVNIHVWVHNSHSDYELEIRVSTRRLLIRDVILMNIVILSALGIFSIFVLRRIRQYSLWKSQRITRRGDDDEESAQEPTPRVTVPLMYLLRSRVSSLWKGLRKAIIAEPDEAE